MDRHDAPGVNVIADAVVIDLAANAIRVSVPGLQVFGGSDQPATLDVGANGRLIGVEIGEQYVSVMDIPGEDDPYARSAAISVDVTGGSPSWISIPRRGDNYEITYPSGNECWQMTSVDGELIQVCATIDSAPGALRGVRELRQASERRPGTGPGSRGRR